MSVVNAGGEPWAVRRRWIVPMMMISKPFVLGAGRDEIKQESVRLVVGGIVGRGSSRGQ